MIGERALLALVVVGFCFVSTGTPASLPRAEYDSLVIYHGVGNFNSSDLSMATQDSQPDTGQPSMQTLGSPTPELLNSKLHLQFSTLQHSFQQYPWKRSDNHVQSAKLSIGNKPVQSSTGPTTAELAVESFSSRRTHRNSHESNTANAGALNKLHQPAHVASAGVLPNTSMPTVCTYPCIGHESCGTIQAWSNRPDLAPYADLWLELHQQHTQDAESSDSQSANIAALTVVSKHIVLQWLVSSVRQLLQAQPCAGDVMWKRPVSFVILSGVALCWALISRLSPQHVALEDAKTASLHAKTASFHAKTASLDANTKSAAAGAKDSLWKQLPATISSRVFAISIPEEAEQEALQAMQGADSILPKDAHAMVAAAAVASSGVSPHQAQNDPSFQHVHLQHSSCHECSNNTQNPQQSQRDDTPPQQRQPTESLQETQLDSLLQQAHHKHSARHELPNSAARRVTSVAQHSMQSTPVIAEGFCNKASAQTADCEQQACNTAAEVQPTPTQKYSSSSSAAMETPTASQQSLHATGTPVGSQTMQLSLDASLSLHNKGNDDNDFELPSWPGTDGEEDWRFECSQYPQPDSYSWDGTDASSDSGQGGGVMAALHAFQSMHAYMPDGEVHGEQKGAACGDMGVSDPQSSTDGIAGNTQGSPDHAVGVARGPSIDVLGEPNNVGRAQPAMTNSGLAVPGASSTTHGQRHSSQTADMLDQGSISHRHAQPGVALGLGAGGSQTSAAVAEIGLVRQHSQIVKEESKRKPRVKRVGVIGEHEVVRRVTETGLQCVVKANDQPIKPKKQGWLGRVFCCGSSATK